MATKGAPIPKNEEDIVKHSMKFYTYLVCLSGLASYPECTRMFRHKNLHFNEIKKAIDITNDTVKLYLYLLEQDKKIIYRGEYISKPVINEYDKNGKLKYSKPQLRAEKLKEAKRVWALRTKHEKDGVYLIPRPNPFTPVPEETLLKLNETLDCSELELKLYYTCCRYQDEVNYRGLRYKPISFELIRDTFKIKDTGSGANRTIHRALCYLKAVGLIDFEEYFSSNSKGRQIRSFKLRDVQKYINYQVREVKESDLMTKEEFEELCARLPDEEINFIDFE